MNRATIKRNEVERRILEGLRFRLMHPELLAEFVYAYHAEWNGSAAVSSQERMRIEQDLRAVSNQL